MLADGRAGAGRGGDAGAERVGRVDDGGGRVDGGGLGVGAAMMGVVMLGEVEEGRRVEKVALGEGVVVGRGEGSVQRRGRVGEGKVKGDVSYQTRRR